MAEIKYARAAKDDYGEWLKITIGFSDDGGETIYVWGCGCCDMRVTSEEPEIHGEWEH